MNLVIICADPNSTYKNRICWPQLCVLSYSEQIFKSNAMTLISWLPHLWPATLILCRHLQEGRDRTHAQQRRLLTGGFPPRGKWRRWIDGTSAAGGSYRTITPSAAFADLCAGRRRQWGCLERSRLPATWWVCPFTFCSRFSVSQTRHRTVEAKK